MQDWGSLTPDGNGVIPISQSLSSIENQSAKDLSDRLFQLSTECGFVSFKGGERADTGAIILCGYSERFRTLSLGRSLNINCLMAQDPEAPWFTGSGLCRDVEHIAEVARQSFPYVRRWILSGQSSGGYAALLLSRKLHGSIAIAFAPQTFDDSVVKGEKIRFSTNLRPSTTFTPSSPIIDLRDLFFKSTPGLAAAYIISAYSEHGNPASEWIWLDAMHWGRLVDHPDVTVFLTDGITHPVLFGKAKAYSDMLQSIAISDDWSRENISAIIHGVTK
jgi:hypothetical protein